MNDITVYQLFFIDRHLDEEVSREYRLQPLAQDWARIGKVIEELGEVIGNLILLTGQNPRKAHLKASVEDLLEELADTAATALLAMTHFTKNSEITMAIFDAKLSKIYQRIWDYEAAKLNGESTSVVK